MTARRLQALIAQVLLTGFMVMFFVPVDLKKEAQAGVFLSAFIGAAVTEYFFERENASAWFWAGPAVVGVAGYVLNYFYNAAGAPNVTGHLFGLFAPLSRPLPLDYASAGTVGALLGYWVTTDQERFQRAAMTGAFGIGYFLLPEAVRQAQGSPDGPRPGAAGATPEPPAGDRPRP